MVAVVENTAQTTVTIVPDNDGRWIEIVNRSPLGVRTSVRDGISVTSAFKSDSREQTTTYETPLGAVLFDNDTPALISSAIGRIHHHFLSCREMNNSENVDNMVIMNGALIGTTGGRK
jgi:hypothetical protein